MKVKVLKRFEDIHTGEIHEAGQVLTVSKKRFEEILKNGTEKNAGILVEEIKEKTTKEAAE